MCCNVRKIPENRIRKQVFNFRKCVTVTCQESSLCWVCPRVKSCPYCDCEQHPREEEVQWSASTRLTASSSHPGWCLPQAPRERCLVFLSATQGHWWSLDGMQTRGCILLVKIVENTDGQMVSDIFYCLWMVRSLDGSPLTQDFESRISWTQYYFSAREPSPCLNAFC